jgi:predicted nucleic acid-binding protein
MNRAVISDTSCLIALSKIDKLELLKELYQEILITNEVNQEFGGTLPEWILIKEVSNKQKQIELEKQLDLGEASSIALALELESSTLIIDETKGRKIAQSYDLDIIGTIGIIFLAEKRGLIQDVVEVILRLVNQGFRLSDKLIDRIIERHRRK